MNSSDRIPLSEALDIYCEHLGLPDRIAKIVKAFASRNADGMVWLSDKPLMVYRDGSDLVIDSEELAKLLKEVNPLKWPNPE